MAAASAAITQLNVYPVKSMAGIAVPSVSLDRLGFCTDRRWMVISEARGRFLSQRGQPKLALVAPRVGDDGALTLSAARAPALRVEPASGPRRTAEIWGDEIDVVDEGPEAAAWLTGILGKRCRLVRIADGSARSVDRSFAPDGQVGLADGFPLLVTGEASLADLNGRLKAKGVQPVNMDRFRPNIVIGGAQPYSEDDWAQIEVGGVLLDLPKPCGRCAIVNTDQATAARSPDVLSTLRGYRNAPDSMAPTFGWNAVHRSTGRLEVGMSVRVVELRR